MICKYHTVNDDNVFKVYHYQHKKFNHTIYVCYLIQYIWKCPDCIETIIIDIPSQSMIVNVQSRNAVLFSYNCWYCDYELRHIDYQYLEVPKSLEYYANAKAYRDCDMPKRVYQINCRQCNWKSLFDYLPIDDFIKTEIGMIEDVNCVRRELLEL